MIYLTLILFAVFLGAFVFQNKTLPGSKKQLIKPKATKLKPVNSLSKEAVLTKASQENEFADIIEERPVRKTPVRKQKPVVAGKAGQTSISDDIFVKKQASEDGGNIELREQSVQMSREAAELKNTDLAEAIELLKSSISMSPVKNYEAYFKLAHYLHLFGQPLESYEIYNQLLEDLDTNDIQLYNAAIANITEKICTRKYKDNEYNDYLYYYSFWLYNHTVAVACRGYIDELNEILRRKDKLHYLAPTKVDGAFKHIGREKEKDIFSYYISMYLAKMRQPLLTAVRRAHYTEIQVKRAKGTALPTAINQQLQRDQEFMINFRKLNDNGFMLFYKEKLAPLLNNGENRNKKVS